MGTPTELPRFSFPPDGITTNPFSHDAQPASIFQASLTENALLSLDNSPFTPETVGNARQLLEAFVEGARGMGNYLAFGSEVPDLYFVQGGQYADVKYGFLQGHGIVLNIDFIAALAQEDIDTPRAFARSLYKGDRRTPAHTFEGSARNYMVFNGAQEMALALEDASLDMHDVDVYQLPLRIIDRERSTLIALYRATEYMERLAKEDQSLDATVAFLKERIVRANHVTSEDFRRSLQAIVHGAPLSSYSELHSDDDNF